MNKILATSLAIVFSNCLSFAQTRTVKSFNVSKDTLEMNAAEDTLEIKKNIDTAIDTIFHQSIVRYDTVLYYLKLQNAYEKAFKLKNDVFLEKMKEPWLGDILKNIFCK